MGLDRPQSATLLECDGRDIQTAPLMTVKEIWPDTVMSLAGRLRECGEADLANSVEGLQVYDRCRCGAEHCATVYTKPKPTRGFGPTHRNIVFWALETICLDTGLSALECGWATAEHTTILDVVNGEVACIEILNDSACRARLLAALPVLQDRPD